MPLLDPYLTDLQGDVDVVLPDGGEYTIGTQPFTTVRSRTNGTKQGYRVVRCQTNKGSKLILSHDEPTLPLEFRNNNGARIILAGFLYEGGYPTLAQPDVLLWGGEVYMDQYLHWSTQAQFLDSFQVDVVKLSDTSYRILRRSGPAFTSTMVGRFCQVWDAELGDPNEPCGTVTSFVSANEVRCNKSGATSLVGHSATDVHCYIGTSPTAPPGGAMYVESRGVNIDEDTSVRCAVLGLDVRGPNCSFGLTSNNGGSTDTLIQGCRATVESTQEPYDPQDREHTNAVTGQRNRGIVRPRILDTYLESRIILDDANNTGDDGKQIDGLELKRIWQDASPGGRVGIQLRSTAADTSESRGVFGPTTGAGPKGNDWAIEDYVMWTDAPGGPPVFRKDVIPDLGVSTENVADFNDHPDRINVQQRNTQARTTPPVAGDVWAHAQNPANVWRSTYGYEQLDQWGVDNLDWRSDPTEPPGSIPTFHPTVFKGTVVGTSLVLTTPGDTPIGAHLIMCIASGDPAATINTPAGWTALTEDVNASTKVARFLRDTRAAGGAEAVTVTASAGPLTGVGVVVLGCRDQAVFFEQGSAGTPRATGTVSAGTYADGFSMAPGTITGNWTSGQLAVAIEQTLPTVGKHFRHDIRRSMISGWNPAVPQSGDWTNHDAQFDYAVRGGATEILICISDFAGYSTDGGGATYPREDKQTECRQFVRDVIQRYKSRWGAGVRIAVECFNEPNVSMKGSGPTAGEPDPFQCALWAYRIATWVHSVDTTIKVGFGDMAAGDTNNALATWGTDIFSYGVQNFPVGHPQAGQPDTSIRLSPLDFMYVILRGRVSARYGGITLTQYLATFGITFATWLAQFDCWTWHAYWSEQRPFAVDGDWSPRGAVWPAQPSSGGRFVLPTNRNYSNIHNTKEVWQWWKLAGLPDSRNHCYISEFGHTIAMYWDPARTYKANEMVFETWQLRGIAEPWNDTTRKWTRGTRYRSLRASVNKRPSLNPLDFEVADSQPWGHHGHANTYEPDEIGRQMQAIAEWAMGERADNDGIMGVFSPGVYIVEALSIYTPMDLGFAGTSPTNFEFMGAFHDAEGRIKGSTPQLGALGRWQAMKDRTDIRKSTQTGAPFVADGPGLFTSTSTEPAALVFFVADDAAFLFAETNGYTVLGAQSTGGRPAIYALKKEALPATFLGPSTSMTIAPSLPFVTNVQTFQGIDGPETEPSEEFSIGALTL